MYEAREGPQNATDARYASQIASEAHLGPTKQLIHGSRSDTVEYIHSTQPALCASQPCRSLL